MFSILISDTNDFVLKFPISLFFNLFNNISQATVSGFLFLMLIFYFFRQTIQYCFHSWHPSFQ